MEETKKHYIPFDFYDFFGYLFPGFLMLLFIGIFIHYENPGILESEKVFLFRNDFTVIQYIIALVGIIILIYLLGHVVATLGALFLERVFHFGIFDLPIFYILNIPHKPRQFVVLIYKFMFFILNIIIILTFFSHYLFVYYLIIILFLLIAFVILGRFIVEGLSYFEKVKNVFHNPTNKFKYFLGFIDKYSNRIFNPFLYLIRSLVNNNDMFNDEFINNYGKLFKEKFKMDYKKADDENIWLPYYCISNDSYISFSLIRTFHHLSGFSRNISCSCFIATMISSFLILFFPGDNPFVLKIVLVVSYFLFLMFYLRYLNLNQNYYMKNILRVFTAENIR